MKNEDVLKKIKRKGINPDNLNSEDIKKLIEMNIKGQIENEVFKEFFQEGNITYKTFIEGLNNFVHAHMSSSNKYSEALEYRMRDLIEQAKNADTDAEKERLERAIDSVLDKLKDEAEANRGQTIKIAMIAAGVGTIITGGAIFVATRNPEILKKGVEIIAKESAKQLL